jgi:peptidoglycan biosynthesis protein MviN/MurJ (putative lipid II flippase)
MLSRHLALSAVQFLALAASLASQMLLARRIGPGVALDQYFAAVGFAAAVVGGVVVASTYLVPAHVQRSAAPDAAANDAMLTMMMCGLLVALPGAAAFWMLADAGARTAPAWLWLAACGWLSALLSIAVSTFGGLGAAHGVVAAPMVLGVLPPGLMVAYLLLPREASVAELASAQLAGAAMQCIGLAWVLRRHWALARPRWPEIRRLAMLVPLGALGAVCFSGYAAVDAVLAPRLGEGTLSHQAIAQRLVIAFGSVVSAGPFMLAPSRVAQLLEQSRSAEIWTYGLRAVLALLAVTAAAAAAMPALGRDLIAAIFQHGTFGPEDTDAVTRAVQVLLLGAGPMLGSAVLFRVLHTLQRARLVAIASSGFLVAYAALAWLLAGPQGPAALALAYTVAWAATLVLTLGLVRASLVLPPAAASAAPPIGDRSP